ncbi:MAG: BMC domain-containing protein [Akkermansiaceae bacterium]
MAIQAIGILETRGLAGLVNGTDAMLKAANVKLAGPMRQIGSAMCNVVVEGDVAAVKAAIDAGASAAEQIGEVLSAHVIARPDASTSDVLPKRAAAKK